MDPHLKQVYDAQKKAYHVRKAPESIKRFFFSKDLDGRHREGRHSGGGGVDGSCSNKPPSYTILYKI